MSWDPVEVDPSPSRSRQLRDGRTMVESRITVSREMIEQMWQGYRCAACLEDVTEHGLGAFPLTCPAAWCQFPMRQRQRAQLEQDFVGEIEQMRRDGWLDREEAFLEEQTHVPKVQIVRP